MSNLTRIGGCSNIENMLGLLFDGVMTEHIISLRLKTTCSKKLSKDCRLIDENGGCHRYRTGTKGSFRVSWDGKNKVI